jgi:hypothetical protein
LYKNKAICWHKQTYFVDYQAVPKIFHLRNKVFLAWKQSVSCGETKYFTIDDYVETLFKRCQKAPDFANLGCDVMHDVCDVKHHSLTYCSSTCYKENDEMTLFLAKFLRKKLQVRFFMITFANRNLKLYK